MLKIHRKLGTYKKINYIFLTEFNKNKFNKLLGNDYQHLFIKPNFVEKKYDLKRPIELNNTFVFIGRLDENKGIKELIENWKKLPKEYILHIYGDGTLKGLVEEAINQFQNIKYFGFQPQEVIFKDLTNSQSLIISSIWYEGFPMIIAESFSLSVPVITVDIGNHATVVKESRAGEVYSKSDFQSFKRAIESIIKNNKELSHNAIKYYNEKLISKKNYKELINIYEKAKIIK